MTHVLLSILDVSKKIFFSGLVLLYLYAVLATAATPPPPPPTQSLISPACTTLDAPGGMVQLNEGQNTSLIIHAMTSQCEYDTCKAANTNCTKACSGCDDFDGAVNLRLGGQGVNATTIPDTALHCSIANATNGSVGYWPATCLATNNLAGRSNYILVLTVMDDQNTESGNHSYTIEFIAGDVQIPYCLASFASGTDKAYLATDNDLLIFLKDAWNNTVGAGTNRPGLTPIAFTLTITWNPDDGTKVTLGSTPTVGPIDDSGIYKAVINPTKTGNYLAKIGVNDTMIRNSPYAFQVTKGKKSSGKFLRPSFLGSGVWCFCLSVLYMAVVSITTGTLM